MKSLKSDDASKQGADIGLEIDENQLTQDLKNIRLGQAKGAAFVSTDV